MDEKREKHLTKPQQVGSTLTWGAERLSIDRAAKKGREKNNKIARPRQLRKSMVWGRNWGNRLMLMGKKPQNT